MVSIWPSTSTYCWAMALEMKATTSHSQGSFQPPRPSKHHVWDLFFMRKQKVRWRPPARPATRRPRPATASLLTHQSSHVLLSQNRAPRSRCFGLALPAVGSVWTSHRLARIDSLQSFADFTAQGETQGLQFEQRGDGGLGRRSHFPQEANGQHPGRAVTAFDRLQQVWQDQLCSASDLPHRLRSGEAMPIGVPAPKSVLQ